MVAGIKHFSIIIHHLRDKNIGVLITDHNYREMLDTCDHSYVLNAGKIIAIDRLFIDNEILWIIDFKTAEPLADESLDQFIRRQQSQHTKQLLFYKEALTDVYSNTIKCAIYCPAVQTTIEIT